MNNPNPGQDRLEELIARLRQPLFDYEGAPCSVVNPDGPEAADTIIRLKDALAFYEDESAWNQPPLKTRETELGTAYENQASKMQRDRGRIAREALSATKIEKE